MTSTDTRRPDIASPEPRPALPSPAVVPHRSRRVSIGVVAQVGRIFVIFLVVLAVAILVWAVLTSFRDTKSIFTDALALPSPWQWSNYAVAWGQANFSEATFNSIVVTGVSSVLTVAIAAPAAYALARSRKRVAHPITTMIILGLGVPTQVLLSPIFIALARTQSVLQIPLLNTLQGLIIVYVAMGLPFVIFLLTGFFRSLPLELEEAAAIDGAGPMRTFWQIVLPVAQSGLVTALILQLISNWNETLFALVIMTSTANRTLPLALLDLLAQQQYSGANWGTIFAGVLILTGPTVVGFLLAGKRLSAGLTIGISR